MDFFCAFYLVILFVILIYLFLTNTFDHWQKQDVPYMPDPVPGFGNIFPAISLRENLASLLQRIYNHSKTSMIGFYFLRKPALIVRDPELIKSVLHTNFSKFHYNLIQVSEKVDPVMHKDPFFTTNMNIWKEGRSRIVSHLSSKKLKYICLIVEDTCAKMSDYVDRKIERAKGGAFETGLKAFFLKCTGEIVANAAFAIQGNNFEDNPKDLPFANLANMVYTPTFINGIRQILLLYFSRIGNYFKIKILAKKSQVLLKRTVENVIKQRERDQVSPNDYLQFCIDANGDDIDGILSDLLIFYDDVYETVSSTLASLFYHLSLNSIVKNKLHEHLTRVVESNGRVTYDSLKYMEYLEQVIFEAMRLTPPVGFLPKVCTEIVTLIGNDGIRCKLEPGDLVVISTLGVHLDSDNWSDPEVFDPERFSAENQSARKKYTFLPFGEGPRMCVGVKLALVLVKFISASLLLKFSVESSSITKLPLVRDPASVVTYIKGDLWAKFKKRSIDES